MYVDKTIAFLRKNKEKPCYVHLWLNDVHDAHVPAPGEQEKFAQASDNEFEQKLFAVLVAMDREIGRLVEAVAKEGLAEETMFVLTGDNGPTAWKRQYYDKGVDPPGDTGPFRGRKWSLYEGGIRQPLIVRWTGKVPAGRCGRGDRARRSRLLSDLHLPGGGAGPGGRVRRDRREGGLPRQAPRTEEGALLGVRAGRELPSNRGSKATGARTSRSGMAIGSASSMRTEHAWSSTTSRVAQDEKRNVADEHPEVAQRMKERLLAWRRSLPVLPPE